MATVRVIIWFLFLQAHNGMDRLARRLRERGTLMMRKLALLFLPLLLIAGSPAVLPKAAAAQEDPPGRVARLNYMEGSVSYQVSGDTDWVQADPNRPLTTGDNLWADKDSRAEVHIGSTAIRLSSETGTPLVELR